MEKSIRQTVKSSTLRAGKKTYFFDVKVASNNKKYLRITESAYEGEGKERKYNSFLLWPENIVGFQTKLTEVSDDKREFSKRTPAC
ncbi:hypothetical protein A3C26_00790 [Candidatus Daviesbacteria bacterium RIFCSPHIGHO2_02_FULL_39_12]|uniref:DNA-binding protein n=2 Tax=Candidatus Daviesiibacteriota TaxID=1752718 RepID=A0A1F5J9N3_9BACT|nr:MAG: hypothetical protein A3C26_00790 [Candidatus Daviesbacteria bacterium RIFCSPHIGHO2_02_FULL_39_12]OGE72594.1 MAG: hypothetical protein A3H40_00860 [Candidatus Daviesbacteria bacterium RIFCSPLOWO2_02_FULL_38_15]